MTSLMGCYEALWGSKVGGYLVRAGSFCYFYNGFLTILKVQAALPARCCRAPDALLACVWRLGASTLVNANAGFSLAGASDSQSGANVVLRGAPSILRKRSIRSKRQCEHCRSCCVYAVGLSVVVYAVPVARATAADFNALRLVPPTLMLPLVA